ncbi:MAG: hypothetical protein GZ088_14990 [Acidipila sp.]|nr:hypothetical protein [Acidipila sp.]
MSEQTPLFILLGASIVLCALLVFRPSVTDSREGKILAFFALFALPVLTGFAGLSAHMEHSKRTEFCLSCHNMEPFGKSLYVDDKAYLAGAHFQNHRVPRDQACFTCHTDYTMYGDLHAKLKGLEHLRIYYFGTPMNPIKLYTPYNNRECLHCHAGARSFEEGPTHQAMMQELKSNNMSCLLGGCHDTVHNIAGLGTVKFWRPPDEH